MSTRMGVHWTVERIVHFDAGDFVKDGYVHFGFHIRNGYLHGIDHQNHFLGRIGSDGCVKWTVAPEAVFVGIPNITANLQFPMYVDVLPDEDLIVSNFGNALLYRIDPDAMTANLLVDGRKLGMVDMGNCVVDEFGSIWVNEVRGCRVRRFDPNGRLVETLGNGAPGFQLEDVSFDDVQFSWIYDVRRGAGGSIYVLDSKNFALREIDIRARVVRTVAGNGRPGYTGDGGDAQNATFGSDPTAKFDGPISLSIDEDGNVYVGDRFNQVVRMIQVNTGIISTIAGRFGDHASRANDPAVREPLEVNLPQISSMDYERGRLFVPTDLNHESGELVVLRKS